MINNILIFMIRGLRPLLGDAECKYPIGCCEYTIGTLKKMPLHKALWKSIKRILSCNPWNKSV
ncbi:MAG: membrane protein insertion efficiency factor YidD [Candidatus Dependentiae bacterium]|nr:membrane protein insertion efficiency factor YidD [Candidatus Dependentiae bacterium]